MNVAKDIIALLLRTDTCKIFSTSYFEVTALRSYIYEEISKIVIMKVIQNVEIIFGAVILHLRYEAARS